MATDRTLQLDLFARQALEASERTERSFHVQTHMTVPEVKAGEQRAEHQDALVLEWFIARPGKHFTAAEVHAALASAAGRADNRERWPLTSTRRALTNLKRRGLIRRHDEDRRDGGFGVLTATWSLAE
jgi:hypothetical protein